MAVKQNRKIKATPATDKANAGADDLSILHPHAKRMIAGKEIEMREYSFLKGLEVRAVGKPFFESIKKFVADGKIPSYEQMMEVFIDHRDVLPYLISIAADVDVEWISSLSDEDGTYLLALWWVVNYPFVYRKIREEIMTRQKEMESVSKTDGQASTQS